MKRFGKWLCLAVCALLLVLAGCAQGDTGESRAAASGSEAGAASLPAASPAASSTASSDGQLTAWTELVCRVVRRDGDTLLLALQQGTENDIYLLDLAALPDEDGSLQAIEAGELVYVTYGGTQTCEIPLRLSGVELVSRARGGFDDRCVLYLQVLEDLWQVGSGLNSGITELGVDLSATSLCLSEQAAVAWAFGQEHGLSAVLGGYEELKAQGYLTPDDPEDPDTLYHWADGCLFSITETPLEGIYNGLRPVRFDAMKWRSGLGAYFFSDCTAVQNALGRWSEYTIGAEAIS